MTERKLRPPVNGTEERLDALIARLDRITDLLTPPPAPTPPEGTVELREPAALAEPAESAAQPAKRRRR